MGSLIISIFFLLMGTFFTINSIPLIESNGNNNVNLEPGVFPMFLGIILMVVSLVMIISSIVSIYHKKNNTAVKEEDNKLSISVKDICIIFACIIVFIVIWQFIHFFAAVILLVLVLFKLFGIFTLKNYVIFTISFSLVIYVVFSVILKFSF